MKASTTRKEPIDDGGFGQRIVIANALDASFEAKYPFASAAIASASSDSPRRTYMAAARRRAT
jgi:hypothetical protein